MDIDIHADLKLRKIINARGTYTPFGVSRSSDKIAQAVAHALKHYFDMAELAEAAGDRIARFYEVESVAFSHCAAGAITMAIAAVMAGLDMDRVYKLPDTHGIANRVVIQAGHLVNYGHPIEQAVRLSGAQIVVAGSENGCSSADLDEALSEDGVCALLCVESRLCAAGGVIGAEAVQLAHAKGLAAVIDGAAQDLRLPEVLGFGADITIISAQKYLSAPTCGVALGRRPLTQAMQLQEKGIGRAMKPTKEGIIGALVAVEARASVDMDVWEKEQNQKAREFAGLLNNIDGLLATTESDKTGLPFERVRMVVDEAGTGTMARKVAKNLATGNPIISVQEDELDKGAIIFEIVDLDADELKSIYNRLVALLN